MFERRPISSAKQSIMEIPHNLLTNLGLTKRDMNDPFQRQLQRRFDEIAFNRTYPVEAGGVKPEHAKIGHIGLHVAKALGKLTMNNMPEDIVEREVVPSLLMYRTQLANTTRYNLARHLPPTVRGRYPGYPLEEATHELATASAVIAAFMERLDHGKYVPKLYGEIRTVAIPALHLSGIVLAERYGINPPEAHASYLQHLLRQPGLGT